MVSPARKSLAGRLGFLNGVLLEVPLQQQNRVHLERIRVVGAAEQIVVRPRSQARQAPIERIGESLRLLIGLSIDSGASTTWRRSPRFGAVEPFGMHRT